ncbi:MAG: 30S ribosomal protein S6 [Actinomycetota bacterium]
MTQFTEALPRERRGPERTARRVQREERPVRPYEVMVILDPGLEDDVIRSSIDRATQVITANGGNAGRVDRWGKRRFAYELHHRWEGYYVLIEASAEPAAMAELDRMLSLADEVIRHKVIRLPDVVANRARPATATTSSGAAADNGGQSAKASEQ